MLSDIYIPVHGAIPQLLFKNYYYFSFLKISSLMNIAIIGIHFQSLSSIQNTDTLKGG